MTTLLLRQLRLSAVCAAALVCVASPASAQNLRESRDTAGLVKREAEIRGIRAEHLQQEVSRRLQSAESLATKDPGGALQELKRVLNMVVASTDIDATVREQLRTRVQQRIEQVNSRRLQIDQNRLRAAESNAQREAARHLGDELLQRDQKLEQLIDRVRSLITEGYLGNADAFEQAEAVSRVAWEIHPYSGTTAAAIFDSEAAGQLDKAQRLRYNRADMFLATLHQVELSHVPFPDEPPVLWPSAEVWQALTQRRKKWASVDLVRYNKKEEAIRRSLDAPTDVEFVDTPLSDAILYLKDLHGINIILDTQALQDDGVLTDTPINLQLAGVSFRSVLKLMLENLQLTYIIDDEVMKITTSAKATDKLYTRVYPVGDLVVPISPQALGGGLGGLGAGLVGALGNGTPQGGGGQNGGGLNGGGQGANFGAGLFSVVQPVK